MRVEKIDKRVREAKCWYLCACESPDDIYEVYTEKGLAGIACLHCLKKRFELEQCEDCEEFNPVEDMVTAFVSGDRKCPACAADEEEL